MSECKKVSLELVYLNGANYLTVISKLCEPLYKFIVKMANDITSHWQILQVPVWMHCNQAVAKCSFKASAMQRDYGR
jgi:hypothetical protein